MIAKKIEGSTEAGSILGAAVRLMGTANEVRAATHDADIRPVVQAYQADMAEKVGQIYDVFRNAEATLSLSLNTIEKVSEACAGDPIMHDVSNLERVVRLVLSSLSPGLDELSEIETDLCSVELSDRFGLVGEDPQTVSSDQPRAPDANAEVPSTKCVPTASEQADSSVAKGRDKGTAFPAANPPANNLRGGGITGDVAIAILETDKVDDLSPIYWACRESAGIASMMALSLDDMIEAYVAEPKFIERLRDLEQGASLMRKRLDAVLEAIDYAQMRVRAST